MLKPLVVVPWGKVESQLLGSLEDHTFGEAEMEDFTKEFDLVEGMVPEGPDGRRHRNFIKMLVNAVMSFSVDSGKNFFIERSINNFRLEPIDCPKPRGGCQRY